MPDRLGRLGRIAERMIAGEIFYLSARSPRMTQAEAHTMDALGLTVQIETEHFRHRFVYALDRANMEARLSELRANEE